MKEKRKLFTLLSIRWGDHKSIHIDVHKGCFKPSVYRHPFWSFRAGPLWGIAHLD